MPTTGLDDFEHGAAGLDDGYDTFDGQYQDTDLGRSDVDFWDDGEAVPAEAADGQVLARSPIRNALEWLFVIGGAVLLAVVVNTLLLQAFYIPSPSMNPTLVNNDRILVNKLANRYSDPDRGQIIVFHRPEGATAGPDAPSELVKRVIGLPGETVNIREGRVVIDGDFLDEPYLPDDSFTDPRSENAPAVVLGEDEYFMMGDNRDNSLDSRVWGPLKRDDIVGRAFVKFWPISDFELF